MGSDQSNRGAWQAIGAMARGAIVLSLTLAAGSLAGCAASPVETGGAFPSGTSQTALVQSQAETHKVVQQGSLSP
jgi:hypothetical protein